MSADRGSFVGVLVRKLGRRGAMVQIGGEPRVGAAPRPGCFVGTALYDSRGGETVSVRVEAAERPSREIVAPRQITEFRADRRFNFRRGDVVALRAKTHLAYPVRKAETKRRKRNG